MWILLGSGLAVAGGGPMNVVVLFNATSPDAAAVADHYTQARSLPDGHRCEVSGIDPLARNIAFADFVALIRDPLDACLAALPHPEEVDYVVTVRGLPYVVDLPTGF